MTALVFVDTSVFLYSVDAGPTETGLRRRFGEPNYGKQPRANQISRPAGILLPNDAKGFRLEGTISS
jgi:hypothetical protein